MAHAHPSQGRFIYNDENNQTSSSLRPHPLFHSTTAPSSPVDQSRDLSSPFNLQNRRLQLRNINFRGSALPSRRLSAHVSKWTPTKSQTERSESESSDTINTSGTTRRRTATINDISPGTSGSILQEINNSSRRFRHSSRPPIANVFEDPLDPQPIQDSPTSWYQDSSTQHTPNPCVSENNPPTMKSPPPLSSPVVKQIKGRRKSRMNLRSASYEQTKYIEHLENLLANTQAKVDSLTSPSVTSGKLGKLRALQTENNSMKRALADWEEKFNERVEDAVDRKVDVEAHLRSHIRSIEQESESKERKIREMEWELERAGLRLSEMESLEATNRSLERRIDVLTELLAQSPTRPQHPLERTSPFKLNTPRPKSMMPRLPSSADSTTLSRSQSVVYADSSTKIAESEENSPRVPWTPGEGEADAVPPKKLLSEDIQPVDLGTRESDSHHSNTTLNSRPVSLLSDSSTSPSSWSMPLGGLTSPEMKSRQGTKNRKMRKFPSGSSQLKPLILPTASSALSFPSSAPPMPSYATPSRDPSGASMDPTTSFLSKYSYDSLFDTPTRRSSSGSARADTLRALEGKYRSYERMDSLDIALSSQDATSFDPDASDSLTENLELRLPAGYASSPPADQDQAEVSFAEEIEQYLEEEARKELEKKSNLPVPSTDVATSESAFKPEPICDLPGIPVSNERETPEQPSGLTEFATGTSPPVTPEMQTLRRRRFPPEALCTPVTATGSFYSGAPGPGVKCSPLVQMVSTNVMGSVSKYTSYFSEFRRRPTALARRIIANAWSTNWARLGRLSWWVLGLFLGPSSRGGPRDHGEEDQFNWHYYSTDASKARRGKLMDDTRTAAEEQSHLARSPANSSNTSFFGDAVSPVRTTCSKCVESSLGRSIRLWAKFSFALVLAIGVAVKDGPESLLETSADGTEDAADRQRVVSVASTPSKVSVGSSAASESRLPDDENVVTSRRLKWVQNLSIADFVDG